MTMCFQLGEIATTTMSRIHLTEHFRYHKRLIECGKRKVDEIYLYKFEDLDLNLEETKTLYQRLDEEKIDKNELVRS